MFEEQNPLTDGQEEAVDLPGADDDTGEEEEFDDDFFGEGDDEEEAETEEEPSDEESSDGAAAHPQDAAENANMKNIRLRAEREAQEAAQVKIDSFYASRNLINPYTNKPIRTEADYKEYEKAYKAEEQKEKLSKGELSPELINDMISQNPVIQKATELNEKMQQEEAERELNEDVKTIGKMDPSIKSIDDLLKVPEWDQIENLLQQGYRVNHAYQIACFDRIKNNTVNAAESAAAESMRRNSNASPGPLGDNNGVKLPKKVSDMSKEEYAQFREGVLEGKYKKS